MKIWLDDLRVAPDGYETAKSVNEAIDLIEECEQNGEEIEVLDYLAERETFYPVEIHTANPVGRENMYRMLDRYWPDLY